MNKTILCGLLLCAAPLPAQTKDEPVLVVLITVDQLRQDYLDRFKPQFTGGLKRLLEQGAVFTNAYQDHANTVTAVGLATLLSGRFPRSNGIISNSLGVPDPQTRTLSGRGAGASPFRFRGTTLIDWLRVQDPLSRGLSVSYKDRAAILPFGRAKQSVLWYSNDGTFTTSTYYADTLPTWVRRFNEQKLPEKYAGMEWKLLLPEASYPEPDTVSLEGQARGGNAFPHKVPQDVVKAVEQLGGFPWMDEILMQLALTGTDSLKLGRTGHIDVLAVSLSTTDAIGHAFGPDSREVHDQILRLDRALGAFLDSLFVRIPQRQVVLAFTSDHGVSPFAGLNGTTVSERRAELHVPTAPLLASLAPLLAARNLPSNAVTFESGILILKEALLKHDRAFMDTITATFVAALKDAPAVARIDYVRDLARKDTINDAITRRWHQAIPRDLAIPVVVTLKEGYLWGSGTSATHGSPHDSDAHVPIIFFGPQFKPGRYPQFTRTVDIAPTLARVLRVQPAEVLDGKPLKQILR